MFPEFTRKPFGAAKHLDKGSLAPLPWPPCPKEPRPARPPDGPVNRRGGRRRGGGCAAAGLTLNFGRCPLTSQIGAHDRHQSHRCLVPVGTVSSVTLFGRTPADGDTLGLDSGRPAHAIAKPARKRASKTGGTTWSPRGSRQSLRRRLGRAVGHVLRRRGGCFEGPWHRRVEEAERLRQPFEGL